MITDADADFHDRDPADPTWTETTFLPFFIPEPGIFGNLYVLARPNLGVALSSILVSEGLCLQPYEVDFTDSQMHLPCPASFRHYTLANGLTVEATNGPKAYRFGYRSRLGTCSFDLEFRALHQPFDPHDPKENPLLGAPTDARMGAHWNNGHFEVKGHVTGRLTLRGAEYAVDCYEGMDHSWGPRPELGTRSAAWISANFGPALAFHIAVPLDLVEGEVRYDGLRFGFVAEDGVVHGLVAAKVRAVHAQCLPTAIEIEVTDVRGRTWAIEGHAVAGHPWYSFNPSHVSYQSYMRYRCGERVGFGEAADIFGLDYLGARMSRAGRRAAARQATF